jgi:hypothetical protein
MCRYLLVKQLNILSFADCGKDHLITGLSNGVHARDNMLPVVYYPIRRPMNMLPAIMPSDDYNRNAAGGVS